jgi:hypothetical protein
MWVRGLWFAVALGNLGWCVGVERRREVEVVDVFESPEVTAADRIIATPGFGAVVPARLSV